MEVIRRDPPVVEGERRSIFYSPRALPRVHGVLTRPGWFSHRDQRTWITQGLFAKGKDQDLPVHAAIETQPFPCFKEMENWLGGTIIAGFHLP